MNHWDSSYESIIMNESRLMIRLNALLNIIGFKQYSFNALFFIFTSFLGIVITLQSLGKLIKSSSRTLLFWSVFIFPSLLIWNAGILKEPFVFLSLGLIIKGTCNLISTKKIHWKNITLLFLGFFFILKLKFYLLCCLLPPFISLLLIIKRNKHPIKPILIVSTLSLLTIIIVSYFSFEYSPIRLLSIKQNDFLKLATFYKAGSKYTMTSLDSSIINFLKSLPIGFINGSFRPFPNDIKSILHLIPLIENLILIVSSIFLFSKRKTIAININKKQKTLVYCSIFFTIILFTLIGITTPVVGAMIRYKTPALLFLIIALISLYDNTKKAHI